MLQKYSFRLSKAGQEDQYSVCGTDTDMAVRRWIERISTEGLNGPGMLTDEVRAIKQQYNKGLIKVTPGDPAFFIYHPVPSVSQIVYIDLHKISPPDFIARVYYFRPEEGGRKNYARSGYRPQLNIQGIKGNTSTEQLFVEKDTVAPGEIITAEIRILTHIFFHQSLYRGQSFELMEGLRTVARGEILEVIHPDLQWPEA